MKPRAIIIMAVLLWPALASGQIPIDPIHKFAWSENIGWTNWKDAGDGSEGVVVEPGVLRGYIWCENTGWINVGSGTPANGRSYRNKDATDFGVNIQSDGTLAGLGWGENIGWINFDTLVKGPDRARFDACDRRFKGYVWAENAGWLNLDDGGYYVAVRQPDCAGIESLRVKCKRSGALNVVLSTLLPEGSAVMARDSADGFEFCLIVNARGRARFKRSGQSGDHLVCLVDCALCEASACR